MTFVATKHANLSARNQKVSIFSAEMQRIIKNENQRNRVIRFYLKKNITIHMINHYSDSHWKKDVWDNLYLILNCAFIYSLFLDRNLFVDDLKKHYIPCAHYIDADEFQILILFGYDNEDVAMLESRTLGLNELCLGVHQSECEYKLLPWFDIYRVTARLLYRGQKIFSSTFRARIAEHRNCHS